MQPSPQSYLTRIQTVTDAVQQEFVSLDPHVLNWKPTPKTWSIAQVFHHLITVNDSYFHILKAVAENKPLPLPWTANVGFLRRFFGRFILQSVTPDRKRKVKTFSVWEPTTSELPGSLVAEFLQHQTQLTAHLQGIFPMLGQGIVIPSPASSVIVYNLEDGLEILVTHEERHLNQAREILEVFGKSQQSTQ